MSRSGLADLPTPHPVAQRLPAVFLDDDFTRRFVSAFDEVLAPVFATLDSVEAYLDPALAPADFVAWLAGWVALDLDDRATLAQQRALVARAVSLHRWRGTRRGLAEQVRLITGGEVDVTESGGCTWSAEPGGTPPGSAAATVTVRVSGGSTVDLARLREIVAGAVPAHVRTTVEVSRS